MADEDTPSIYDVFGDPPDVNPNRFDAVPVVPDDGAGVGTGQLPHWSAPPTGQVPRVQAEPEVWNDLSGPRWRGESSGWADDDLEVVFGDEGSAVRHDDILNFDDPRLNNPAPPRPDLDLDDPFGDAVPAAPAAASLGTEPPAREATGRKSGAKARTRSRNRASQADQAPANNAGDVVGDASDGMGRNMGQAIGVGLGLAALAAVLILIHPVAGTLLIAAAAALAAVEFFDAVRHGEHNPATMLGLTGAALFPIAAYWRGEQAYAVLMAITVIFGGLWYIVGADRQRPLTNLAVTLLGVFWIGGSASFGGLLLRLGDGQKLLLGAIIVTAIADTTAFFGGKTFKRALFGDRVFNEWSPGKSWEGTVFGIVGATVGALVLDAVFSVGTSWWHAAAFGLVIGIMAVIGDLFESMLKRDLKLKDMGALLPGHGGLLDRVDALLFVLPAAYFLSRVLDYV